MLIAHAVCEWPTNTLTFSEALIILIDKHGMRQKVDCYALLCYYCVGNSIAEKGALFSDC